MYGNNSKIQSFTDLNAWQEAHKLVLMVYETTKAFPKEEMFGLTSQIRRAAVSVSANIAEGFSRNSAKEKLQFYAMSLGSLTEVQSHLLIARDLKYTTTENFVKLNDQANIVNRLIHGLMRTAQTRNT